MDRNRAVPLNSDNEKVSTNSPRLELEVVSRASDVDEFENIKNDTI